MGILMLMNIPVIFRFLKELAANNNREWFNTNRERYEKARQMFEEMVQQIILRIAGFDETVIHLQVKDCTYRFYRDTRFSEDKSPYKRHLGAYINAHGKKSFHSGYYFQHNDWKHAMSDYCKAAELNPDSPAVAAYRAASRILDFYNKDLYNP